ncbi:hypothetical protein RHMOL_Rhmol05G0218200 [Rhododendron molle]|uniref:Uncharacterized protein n=1 Tax=Rhododendron molle TaxID=49168 RepID=A0ACC0NTB6_RHOML|nr:hypothetical protein RHMOL_Rhmol05G0218200 [Rhododendron molle]
MGKGQAWVNGQRQSIGRYWHAYRSPSTGCFEKCDYKGSYSASKCLKYCGQPAQTLYHIPRPWVHPGDNLLVLHEELGGDPSRISFSTRAGQEICAHFLETDVRMNIFLKLRKFDWHVKEDGKFLQSVLLALELLRDILVHFSPGSYHMPMFC